MPLKQPPTRVLIDSKGVVIIKVLDTFFQPGVFETLVDGS